MLTVPMRSGPVLAAIDNETAVVPGPVETEIQEAVVDGDQVHASLGETTPS